MKGIILINAYSENGDYLYQANRLQTEFLKLNVSVEIVRNACGIASIGEWGERHLNLSRTPDFCVYLDKDKYTARFLERAGVRLFNPAESIFTCDDKMLTHIALSGKNIPMPDTVHAPFCYTQSAEITEGYLDDIIGKLSLPVVVKHSYGSLGREVYLAKTREQLKKYATELRFTPHFYQKYVGEYGKDLRVIAVGGKFVAAMERSSEGKDFRSNIALGGGAVPFQRTDEVERLTEKIADTLHLDYCGIDFLSEGGKWMVCEVNSNAYFKGMEKTTGVNVARIYAEYILKTME